MPPRGSPKKHPELAVKLVSSPTSLNRALCSPRGSPSRAKAWSLLPIATEGIHWRREHAPEYSKSGQAVSRCLILSSTSCSTFSRRSYLEDHFTSVHNMFPSRAAVGRPKTSNKPSRYMSSNAREKLADHMQGDFPYKFWKAKKKRFEMSTTKARHMWLSVPGHQEQNEEHRLEWIRTKADEFYKAWREGPLALSTMTTLATNVEKYWQGKGRSADEIEVLGRIPRKRKFTEFVSDEEAPVWEVNNGRQIVRRRLKRNVDKDKLLVSDTKDGSEGDTDTEEEFMEGNGLTEGTFGHQAETEKFIEDHLRLTATTVEQQGEVDNLAFFGKETTEAIGMERTEGIANESAGADNNLEVLQKGNGEASEMEAEQQIEQQSEHVVLAPDCDERKLREERKELETLRRNMQFLAQHCRISSNEIAKTTDDMITFVVNKSHHIKAHLFILAGVSPVFEGMFATKMRGKVPINDVSFPAMEAMVNFCYTTEIKFSDEIRPEDVVHISHKYKISSLTELCETELCNRMENITKSLSVDQGVDYLLATEKDLTTAKTYELNRLANTRTEKLVHLCDKDLVCWRQLDHSSYQQILAKTMQLSYKFGLERVQRLTFMLFEGEMPDKKHDILKEIFKLTSGIAH